MREKIAQEHIEVIKTMLDAGMIDTQTARTIRGNVLKMNTYAEREEYLKKIIKGSKAMDIKKHEGLTPQGIPVSNECLTCNFLEYSKRYKSNDLEQPFRLQAYCGKTKKENDYVVHGCEKYEPL